MDYITSTQLRTHTPLLISAIRAGKTVRLVHRSKQIAVISDGGMAEGVEKMANGSKFLKLVKKLKPNAAAPSFGSNAEMRDYYLQELTKKHG